MNTNKNTFSPNARMVRFCRLGDRQACKIPAFGEITNLGEKNIHIYQMSENRNQENSGQSHTSCDSCDWPPPPPPHPSSPNMLRRARQFKLLNTQFLQLTADTILSMLDNKYGQCINSYQAMGKFSKWQTDDSFLIFSKKQMIWQFMQIVSSRDNLHEISNCVYW